MKIPYGKSQGSVFESVLASFAFRSLLLAYCLVVAWPAIGGGVEPCTLSKVWMSAQWYDPMEDTIRMCAEQGVDVVEVRVGTNRCAYALSMLRKHGMKGFISCRQEPSKFVSGSESGQLSCERAVFTGGAYRGKAIDRTLFTFEPRAYDIVVEPPVYSKRQGYTKKAKGRQVVKSGHYFGSFVPTGEAEVIVPEKPFDGRAHVRIITCEVLSAEPGTKPENETVTAEMSGPEIENRRLVRLRFDLSGCKGMMLDKVGLAVYWASDEKDESWRNAGRGQFSVFSQHTRDSAYKKGFKCANAWALANGGIFPSDEIIAIRFGDECFNLTGWLDCAAASFPLWGFSPSGRAAFAVAAPGLVQPRTWGYPEIYGEKAYGHALYCYHKACAELTHAFVKGVRSVAPSLKVFRNTTRGDVWCEANDHDGSGQELLARELDFIHLDPYPVGKEYRQSVIPFDMGYMCGFARRFGKPLIPWMQAHSYAPGGLGNITPADMKRMWAQHLPFAPDGMMWLGFDIRGKNGMTFPKGSPESWVYAKELFAAVHGTMAARPHVAAKPVAQLAVLRPYTVRATCCSQGASWEAWRNPADRILREYVSAWSVDHALQYDVFEIPPAESDAERTARENELRKYKFIVSSAPYPGAYVVGKGTEGTVMKADEIDSLRKTFSAEISELKIAKSKKGKAKL